MSKFLSLFTCIFALFSYSVFSQEKPSIEQVFSTENSDCEILLSVLDLLRSQTANDSNSFGYIIISGSKNPIDNAFYFKFIEYYIKTRELQNKVFFKFLESKKDKVKTEFLIGEIENFSENPVLSPDLKLSGDTSNIQFAGDLWEGVIDNGKQFYYSVSSGCYIQNIDFDILSEILKANPALKAYVVIRGKNLSQSNKVKKFINSNAERRNVIPNRLKIFYAGKNKINDNQFF